MTLAVLGLGEAGSRIARDLAAAGARVRGFDPAVAAPPGIEPAADDAGACRGAALVLSLTTAGQFEGALRQALPALGPGVGYADANTASAGSSLRLADLAEQAGCRSRTSPSWPRCRHRGLQAGVPFADIAIMAPVPPRGLRTPMLASGPAAAAAAGLLNRHGASVGVLPGPARDGRHPQAAAQRVLQGHGRGGGRGAAGRPGSRPGGLAAGAHRGRDWPPPMRPPRSGWSTAATSTPPAGPMRWPRPATSSRNSACRPASPGPASTGWRTWPGPGQPGAAGPG